MERLPAPPLPDWLESMLSFSRYQVQTRPYRFHVMEQGEGFPVLLLHGNPMWGFLYRKVARALRKLPLRLIMPDLIGLGLSERPLQAREHSLEHHSSWLVSLLDTLELDRVLLVCHDWGGPIGLHAFSRQPSRLAGLVVLNTVLDAPRPGFRPTPFHRFSHWPLVSDLAFRVLGFPQNVLHRVQAQPASIRGVVARAYRYPLHGRRLNAAPLALARMVPDSLQHPSVPALRQVREFAGSLTIPAAIVWGDRDPILGRLLSRVKAALPNAPVIRTGAGHFLQEEVPGPIAEAIAGAAGRCLR